MIVPDSSHTNRFREWTARRLGLRFEDSQLTFLSDVLAQRATSRALPCLAYVDELERSAPDHELHALVGALTVPETYFFRHIEQYRAYAEIALPAAQRAHSPDHRPRVLSVGCASGEEPYSLVMWARDHGGWPVDAVAVDINPAMLGKATRGLYSSWALRETPDDVRQRWFHSVSHGFELDPEIRKSVHFERINLAQEHAEFWTPQRFDIIFCRNVLMYFTPDIARAAMARMTLALAPRGHLFLGHAETMRGLSNDYQICHTHNAFYYQRQASPAILASGIAEAYPAVPFSSIPVISSPPDNGWPEAIRQSADRVQALSESHGRVGQLSSSIVSDRTPAFAAQIQSALDFLKRERFGEALALIDGMTPERACHPEALLLRAALLMHSGQLDDAEEVSQQLLKRDAANAGAHYLLALCRESAGDLPGALAHDVAAISIDKEFAMPRLHQGLMARRGGDWEGARRALGEAMPLLERENASRVLLFGGGFGREGLIALCRAELQTANTRV